VSLVVRVARSAGIVALFLVAALAGTLSGVLFAYAGDLPQISTLDDYAPSTITRVYGTGGELVGEFAVQRRLIVGYDDIAPHLRQAIIAAEDGDFDTHFGLSISHIVAAVARDVLQAIADTAAGRARSRPGGASTLTQQLARSLFPEAVGFKIGDLSLERKVKEAIVAVQIEKRYTKAEILTFYANHMLLGHGTYGVEAGARMYFGKSAKDVNLEEAALLAGIFQSPGRQSPFVNMEAATGRRNYALQRMADEAFITQAEADEAKKRPVIVREPPQLGRTIAPHFLEEVRQHLEQTYGAKALYESGLSVSSTLDVKLQEVANRAVSNGLRSVDKRRGFRRPARNVIAEGVLAEAFKDERWTRPIAAGDIVPAVVMTLDKPAPANGARLRIGRYYADLTPAGFAWTRRPAASALFKVGDVIEVRVTKLDEASNEATVTLEQRPLLEAALVAIDNRTGHIRAMVGGQDFSRSKFNRAVQAFRQLGSTFKPVVFTAAIDRGFTPASVIVDAPVTYPSGDGIPYSPQNYDHQFEGPVTLRRSLEQSRNIPAIKLMEALGPSNVVSYAKRFGFSREFPPYLPVALGAGEGTLLEVTSAYTVFPNQGVRMKPFDVLKVTDRDGNLLEENRSEALDVVRADTAFVVTNLLRGVVQRGTAASAASIEWTLAGKTGTVDDNTDAWFVGFDPFITVGVWVGYDEKKPIGFNETGAQAALPIWIEFMKAYIDGRPDKDTPPDFDAPGNIVFLAVDRTTGAVLSGGSEGGIAEAFISGTQPGAGFLH
jgi:penicillin-binding protein 1A